MIGGSVAANAGAAEKQSEMKPDPAGDQVLELTDGSKLHGKLTALGKSELIWQRPDASEPLVFAPQDVRRIVLSKPGADKAPPAGATIKLTGSDWLAGKLAGFDGKHFQLDLGLDHPLRSRGKAWSGSLRLLADPLMRMKARLA